jgi:hypothetical protein
MPRGDRTGPAGLGSMTGRGLGYCAGFDTPGYTRTPGFGRGLGLGYGPGWGRGRGRGRGRYWRGVGYGYPYYDPIRVIPATYSPQPVLTKENRLEMLKQEKEYLETEMSEITSAVNDLSKRIAELEKEE